MPRFPNLARSEEDKADEAVVKYVTDVTTAELNEAGIAVHIFPLTRSEVPSKVIGSLRSWAFQRAWTYWIASGPGMPVEDAERLHATHGKEVRVDGHCGCPSPSEWFEGFGVGTYHVDTAEGLRALAETIRAVGAARVDKTIGSLGA